MNQYIDQFNIIRNNLFKIVHECLPVFCDQEIICNLDPIVSFSVMKEVNRLFNSLTEKEYPTFPKQLLPKFKLIIDDEDYIRGGVQKYLNIEKQLIFLGHTLVNNFSYDLYCRKSIDPRFNYVLYAKYGHKQNEIYKGARQAASEYLEGKETPLATAFKYAVYAGYID